MSAGAQIIDLMMLIVDVTKGIQTQTAEVSEIKCFIQDFFLRGNANDPLTFIHSMPNHCAPLVHYIPEYEIILPFASVSSDW